MRTVQFDNKKAMAAKLAASCWLLSGRTDNYKEYHRIARHDYRRTRLETGDEAVMAEQDYPAMLDMFKQVSKRYGVINKMVSVPNHPKIDEEIVESLCFSNYG